MADTVSDAGNVEQTGSADIDEVLLLVFLALGVVFALAVIFDYQSLAGLGVGEIGSFLAPVQAFFNGLANLITGLFQGLAKNASTLSILLLHAIFFNGLANLLTELLQGLTSNAQTLSILSMHAISQPSESWIPIPIPSVA